jgi:hypothetical protein
MTIISTVVVTGNVGVDPKELLGHLAKGLAKLQTTEGVQKATLSAVAIGGAATNSMVFIAEAEDWEAFGKAQAAINSDPEWIQLLLDGGQFGTWQTFVAQTIDFDLLPS